MCAAILLVGRGGRERGFILGKSVSLKMWGERDLEAIIVKIEIYKFKEPLSFIEKY